MLNVYARTQVKVAGERVDMVIRHSGYFPSGFMVSRSYRSYGSEVTE